MDSPSNSIWLTADSSIHVKDPIEAPPTPEAAGERRSRSRSGAPSSHRGCAIPALRRKESAGRSGGAPSSSRASSVSAASRAGTPPAPRGPTVAKKAARPAGTNPFARRASPTPTAPKQPQREQPQRDRRVARAPSQPDVEQRSHAAPRSMPPLPRPPPQSTTPVAPSSAKSCSGFSGIGGDSCFLEHSLSVVDPAPTWTGGGAGTAADAGESHAVVAAALEQHAVVSKELSESLAECDALRSEVHELRQRSASRAPSTPSAALTRHSKADAAGGELRRKYDDALARLAELLAEKEAWDATKMRLEDVAAQLRSKDAELGALQSERDSRSASAARHRNAEEGLRETLREHRATIAELRGDVEQLRAAASEATTCVSGEVAALQRTIASQAQELEQRAREIGERDVNLDFAGAECAALKAECEALQRRVREGAEELASAAARHTSAIEALRAEHDEQQRAAAAEASRRFDAAGAELEVRVKALEGAFEAERARLEEELDAAKAAAGAKESDVEARLAEAEARCEELRAALEAATAAHDEKRAALEEEHARHIKALEVAHAEALRKAVDDHFAKLEQVQEENMQARVEVADLSNRLSLKDSAARSLEVALRTATERAEAVREQLADAEAERDALNRRVETLSADLERSTARAADVEKQQREHHETRIRELSDQLVAMRRAREEEEAAVSDDLELLREQLQEAKDALAHAKAQWGQERMALMTDATEARARAADLTREMDDHHADLVRAKRTALQLEDENRALIIKKNELQREVDAAEAQVRKDRGVLELQTVEIAKLQARCSRLESDAIRGQHESRVAGMSPIPRAPSASSAPAQSHAMTAATATPPPYSRKTSRAADSPAPAPVPLALAEHSSNRAAGSTTGSAADLPQKRQRFESNPPCSRRVFTITGFNAQEAESLIASIRSIPGATYAESSSNRPVNAEVTHCITNGNLTLKLLSAAAKGCWVLPASYVTASRSSGAWLDEASVEGGFRHSASPLSGKTIGFSDLFRRGKKYPTIATVCEDSAVQQSENHGECDLVLCSSAEEAQFGSKGINFEKFLRILTPQLKAA